MRFADKLNELLARKGITQDVLAAALDLNQSSVSRWMNGAVPHRRTAAKLATFFGVTADQLLRDEIELPGTLPPKHGLTPDFPPVREILSRVSEPPGRYGTPATNEELRDLINRVLVRLDEIEALLDRRK